MYRLFSKGATKATNEVRELVRCVKRDLIPTHWRAECSVPQDLPLSTFLRDIAFRVRVLDSYFPFLSNATGAMTIASSKLVFALGNMFLPETFITGLRQVAAQVHGWSLEELELVLDINCTTSRAPTDALVEGLCLEGAEYSGNGSLVLSELLSCLLPPSRLSWHKSTSTGSGGTTSLVLPLYRDQTRMTLVCNLVISNPYSNKSTGGDLSESWTQRSVAVVMKSYGL